MWLLSLTGLCTGLRTSSSSTTTFHGFFIFMAGDQQSLCLTCRTCRGLSAEQIHFLFPKMEQLYKPRAEKFNVYRRSIIMEPFLKGLVLVNRIEKAGLLNVCACKKSNEESAKCCINLLSTQVTSSHARHAFPTMTKEASNSCRFPV